MGKINNKKELMQRELRKKILEEAYYFIQTKSTIRKTAEEFNISKSTIHRHFKYNLKDIDFDLYNKVAMTLGDNLKNRHLRGGHSTSLKYKNLKAKQTL